MAEVSRDLRAAVERVLLGRLEEVDGSVRAKVVGLEVDAAVDLLRDLLDDPEARAALGVSCLRESLPDEPAVAPGERAEVMFDVLVAKANRMAVERGEAPPGMEVARYGDGPPVLHLGERVFRLTPTSVCPGVEPATEGG
ncbi:MAG TPA: hypothetical protein VGB14_07630 [Acidimicrobiales bacterium]|jgi:hypothetical protein